MSHVARSVVQMTLWHKTTKKSVALRQNETIRALEMREWEPNHLMFKQTEIFPHFVLAWLEIWAVQGNPRYCSISSNSNRLWPVTKNWNFGFCRSGRQTFRTRLRVGSQCKRLVVSPVALMACGAEWILPGRWLCRTCFQCVLYTTLTLVSVHSLSQHLILGTLLWDTSVDMLFTAFCWYLSDAQNAKWFKIWITCLGSVPSHKNKEFIAACKLVSWLRIFKSTEVIIARAWIVYPAFVCKFKKCPTMSGSRGECFAPEWWSGCFFDHSPEKLL
jgi:hypothetical protein